MSWQNYVQLDNLIRQIRMCRYTQNNGTQKIKFLYNKQKGTFHEYCKRRVRIAQKTVKTKKMIVFDERFIDYMKDIDP